MATETARQDQDKQIATKTKSPAVADSTSGSKEAAHRMANVQRKKKAHKRNIRSSNANG